MERIEPEVAIAANLAIAPRFRLRLWHSRARTSAPGDALQAILALLAALSLLPPASGAAVDPRVPAGWKPDVRAAREFAQQRQGEVSFAVRTRRRAWGHRRRMDVNSASVFKAMLLVAYLDHPSVRGRALRASDRALLAPMIRYSDNDTATRVRNFVGAERIERLARRARMKRFRLSPVWGLSQINAEDQSRYFLRLPELVVARHRAYALKLLSGIVPEQRWGVAKVRPRGWKLYFKGGWGSGTGLVSHQVALLARGRQRVSLAIMTTGSPNHEYSQETLRGVAARLLRGLDDVEPPARRASDPSARALEAVAATATADADADAHAKARTALTGCRSPSCRRP